MATTPQADFTLADLAKNLIADLKGGEQAKDALDKAKAGLGEKTEMSIRAFATRISGINRTFDDKDVEFLAEAIAKAYPKSQAKTKSNMKTLIGQRHHLPAILESLDATWATMQASNADAKMFNIRQATISAAIKLRDDEHLTVDEAVEELKLNKAPATPTQLMRTHLDRMRKSPLFQESVGDVKVLDPDAEQAIRTLEALVDGQHPGQDPRITELEEQLESLRAALADVRPKLGDETREEVEGFLSDIEHILTPAETVEGTQDGSEESTVLDTSQTPEATPAPAQPVPGPSRGVREAALSGSLTPFDGIEELMNSLKVPLKKT